MLLHCDTCGRKTMHLTEKGACLDHCDMTQDADRERRQGKPHALQGKVVIPAYSPKDALHGEVVPAMPKPEPKIPSTLVMLPGVDIRQPTVDNFPKIKNALGELVDDPDQVQCSFCENVIHVSKATFGKGPLRDIRVEDVIQVGDQIVTQVHWVKWSSSMAACSECCLNLVPKEERRPNTRNRDYCGPRTTFHETKG